MSYSRGFLLVAMLLLTFGGSSPLRAALDMFLDIPGIPGESVDIVHKDQIDVLAWGWGMSNPGTVQAGGGAGAGKANFQDLSVTKYVDKASPLLMADCAKGSHVDKATLFVRKAGKVPIEYIKIQLTNVLVRSVSTGGSGGEDRLTENISLNFAQMQMDYVPTKPDGSADPAVSFKWDIASNSGSGGGIGTGTSPAAGLTATINYTSGAPVARLTWISVAGVHYQVWATSDWSVAFQPYGGPIASAGDGTTSVTLPADAIRMFFRIETISGQ
jgi:type VI secretion system secreted protein Hcp